jgi:DNA-binding XRE family transcriptional regulator
VELEPEEAQQNPAVAAFIAELRHWREVAGCSKKRLADLVEYTPSYVSKVERGTMLPSLVFAESADQHLRAGRALIRRWREMHDAVVEMSGGKAGHDEAPADDPQSAPGPDLVVGTSRRSSIAVPHHIPFVLDRTRTPSGRLPFPVMPAS